MQIQALETTPRNDQLLDSQHVLSTTGQRIVRQIENLHRLVELPQTRNMLDPIASQLKMRQTAQPPDGLKHHMLIFELTIIELELLEGLQRRRQKQPLAVVVVKRAVDELDPG